MRAFCRGSVLVLGLAVAAAAMATPVERMRGAERVVAVGDVHGAYDRLAELLRKTGLVDAEGHWSGGRTHLVSLGDLVDRGPDSRRAIDRLMQLEAEAQAAGGAVHVVLGNHEVMNLAGDWRDVSAQEVAAFAADEDEALRNARREDYVARQVAAGAAAEAATAEFERRFPRGWFARRTAFGAEGRYGRWLLARPVALQIDDSLFVHAGLSRLALGYDLARLNQEFHAALTTYLADVAALESAGWSHFDATPDARVAAARQRSTAPDADPALVAAARRVIGFEALPLFGIEGPVWYRGMAICHPLPQTDVVDAVLAHYGAGRIVLGHTVTRDGRIVTRFDGRVFTIDTGMLDTVYHGRASALELGPQGPRALYADGSSMVPGPDPRPLGLATFALADAQKEAVLKEATLRALPADATGRVPVELDYRGQKAQAWFLPDPPRGSAVPGRWQHELATYALDRMLGLYLVPATIARELDGKPGALQWREPGTVAADDPASNTPGTTVWCDLATQYELVYLLDALILNEGRTLASVGYSPDEWLVLSSDHRAAYGPGRGLPATIAKWQPKFGRSACSALAALDAAGLEARLGPWLKPRQVKSLLERRDRLLKSSAANGGVSCSSSGSPAAR